MIFRPPSPCHLSIPHIQQRHNGECLAACVNMVCSYLKKPIDYNRLVKLLRIQKELGTPFTQVQNIQTLGIEVNYQEYGALNELYNLLCGGWPSIVGLKTNELPYWKKVNVQHAVVVVGMDADHVYLNDPAFPNAPVRVLLGDFDLAWLA